MESDKVVGGACGGAGWTVERLGVRDKWVRHSGGGAAAGGSAGLQRSKAVGGACVGGEEGRE